MNARVHNFIPIYNGFEKDYRRRGVLSNGQFIEIFFREMNDNPLSKKLIYNAELIISDKNKSANWGELDGTSSGSSGIEGLLWAKKALLEFEKFLESSIKDRPRQKQKSIVIYGSNSKRRRVYNRYLKRLGYIPTRLDGSLCMRKVIK